MIKIRRPDPPDCLIKPDNEFGKGDCRKADVKRSLSNMQHGKCCYCEKKISEGERDVEHYVPKSALKDGNGEIRWYLANKWENLLCACKSCNSMKGDQHPIDSITGDSTIINPSLEDLDPEDHIDFFIDDYLILFKERDGSPLGSSTIEKLQFRERGDLFADFRLVKLDIDRLFMELVNASMRDDEAMVISKTSDLTRNTSAHHSFAAFHRKYIDKKRQELNTNKQKLEAAYGKPLKTIEIYICKGSEVMP